MDVLVQGDKNQTIRIDSELKLKIQGSNRSRTFKLVYYGRIKNEK